MTLVQSLHTATSGLNAVSDSLQVTSDNISNVNNENYSRREAAYADDVHGGVRIASIRRVTDKVMQTRFWKSVSAAEESAVREEVYARLSNALGISQGQSRLTQTISSLVEGFRDLQAAPENPAVAYKIESAAREMATLIRSVAEEIELVSQQVESDLADGVELLNDHLREIDKLNNLILSVPEDSPVRSGYENQRSYELDELNKLISTTVQSNRDGTVSVYSRSGITLVSGYANTFTWDSGNQRLESTFSSRNLADELSSGSLKAQYMMIKEYVDVNAGQIEASDGNLSLLQKLRDQLDGLVQLFVKPSSKDNPTTLAGAFGAAVSLPEDYPGDNIPGDQVYYQYWSKQLFVPSDISNDDVQDVNARNFYVNDELVESLKEIATNESGIGLILNNLTARTRDLTLNSLDTSDHNYESLATTIQINFSVRQERIDTLHKSNLNFENNARAEYRSKVGVNLDEEMARITVLQNSYVATAKIISTINNMFASLERVI